MCKVIAEFCCCQTHRRRKDSLIRGAQFETTHGVVSNVYNILWKPEREQCMYTPNLYFLWAWTAYLYTCVTFWKTWWAHAPDPSPPPPPVCMPMRRISVLVIMWVCWPLNSLQTIVLSLNQRASQWNYNLTPLGLLDYASQGMRPRMMDLYIVGLSCRWSSELFGFTVSTFSTKCTNINWSVCVWSCSKTS